MVIPRHPLTVRTRRIQPGDPLHDPPLPHLLPGSSAMSWVRGADGLVGWGIAARTDTYGPQRFTDADQWWRDLRTRMRVDDEVRLPGTGPAAFASMAFAAEPGHSALVVPQVLVGQRDGVRWITTIGDTEQAHRTPEPVRAPGPVRYRDGWLSARGYREAVAEAVRRMRAPGGIDKIVLAHDLLATTTEPVDTRFLLHRLAAQYPDCWTFAVDGLVGATPELLLERTGDRIRSRVLAGTAWPHDGASQHELVNGLLASTKNRDEHAYAAASMAASLRPFCDALTVPDEPSVLRLRNVLHLATDISGTLNRAEDDAAHLLHLADAAHPTAAVGGTPTLEAVRMIGELERMDRERYAGPVGWLDGAGNGELGLALRCARIEPGGHGLRLFAGAGIVADSDPDLEADEVGAKLRPMLDALSGTDG